MTQNLGFAARDVFAASNQQTTMGYRYTTKVRGVMTWYVFEETVKGFTFNLSE